MGFLVWQTVLHRVLVVSVLPSSCLFVSLLMFAFVLLGAALDLLFLFRIGPNEIGMSCLLYFFCALLFASFVFRDKLVCSYLCCGLNLKFYSNWQSSKEKERII